MAGTMAVVTGIGVLSQNANSVDDLRRLLSGGRMAPPGELTAFEPPAGAPEIAFELADFDIASYLDSVKSYCDRTSALAAAGVKLALDHAGLGLERPDGCGLAFATSWGCLDSMEVFFAKVAGGSPKGASPLVFSHSYANSPAAMLAIEFKLNGFHSVVSAGWNSSTVAISQAAEAISRGECDIVVAGGAEAISPARFGHLLEAGVIGPDAAVMGEGACVLVLESAESANSRGAAPLASISGSGASGGEDRFEAMTRAIVAACASACVEPSELEGYFGAASGIAEYDSAELAGMAAACGMDAGAVAGKSFTAYHAAGLVEGTGGSFAAAIGALATGGVGGPVVAGTLDPGGSAAALLISPAVA